MILDQPIKNTFRKQTGRNKENIIQPKPKVNSIRKSFRAFHTFRGSKKNLFVHLVHFVVPKKSFRVFRVFRGSKKNRSVPSAPSVVPKKSFRVFRAFRGSKRNRSVPSAPSVVPKKLFVYSVYFVVPKEIVPCFRRLPWFQKKSFRVFRGSMAEHPIGPITLRHRPKIKWIQQTALLNKSGASISKCIN